MGTGSEDPLLAAFTGPLPEVRVGTVYRLGLALVALTMVLLPLAYVALIGLAGYGVYWHVTENQHVIADTSGIWGFVIFLVPVIVGGILVLFMVKPLFAPEGKAMEPVRLTPEQEPRLHAFVHRLCEVVGAPRPRQIVVDCDANASAGFRRGLVSLLSNDLVLTIGLPLAGGLSLRALAGVLAHEFGHFAQRTGMRLTFVIRSVNGWFARVVYTRDSWDDALVSASDWDIRVAVVVWIARFFVWVTRGVLWVLMMLGHALSCFMLRQMEFDADRYEAYLAGGRVFTETARRLPLIAVGAQFAHGDLEDSLHDERLVDDFVALALENEANLPDAVREEVRKLVDEETTGLLDTHPATAERIASVAALRAPGLFSYEGPATDLFADFGALSRTATRDFYAAVLGDEAARHKLVPFDEYVSARNQVLDELKTVRRFFQGAVHPLRPLRIPHAIPDAAVDPAQAENALREARETLVEGVDIHREQFGRFDALDDRRSELRHAQALLEADLTIDHDAFELAASSVHASREAQAEVDFRVAELLPQMAPLEEVASRRFWTALNLARAGVGAVDEEGGAEAQREQIDRLLPVVVLLTSVMPRLVILRDESQALITLVQQLEDNEDHQPLHGVIFRSAEALRRLVTEFGNAVRGHKYPLEHEGEPPSLRKYLLGDPPEDDELGEAIVPAQNAVERGYRLYSRVLGRLCAIAERAESTLGFAPLDDPPDPPPPDDDNDEDDDIGN